MRGVDDYLLAKLVSSGVLRADEPLLEASIEMAGKLAPGRQSGHGVNAGAGVRYQVARIRWPAVGSAACPAGRPGRSVLALSCRPGCHRRCRRHGCWVVPGRWATIPGGGDARCGLTDRRAECGVLDQLIDAVRAGGSRVLVVRGEPGVGKSALLDYLAGRASGCRVVRAAGVESEMELAFAGLHQLLAPVLDRAGARCRGRSGRRCGPRSASARARCRTGSWWGWRCWGWCRRWPPSGRWCAWWMTSSGWTGPRCRRWGSWRGGWRPSRWAWCSRPGCRGRSWRGCRSWRWRGWGRRTRGRCWIRR